MTWCCRATRAPRRCSGRSNGKRNRAAKATLTWRIAQAERQTTIGIRGGGAAASRQEAAVAIEWGLKARGILQTQRVGPVGTPITPLQQEAIATAKAATAANLAHVAVLERLKASGEVLAPETAAALMEAAASAAAVTNATFPESRVAILFRSGGPFLYLNSVSSDYYRIVGAGSKGKEVWKMGWGPNRSPRYVSYPIIASEKILATQAVSSSWLLQVWLVDPTANE